MTAVRLAARTCPTCGAAIPPDARRDDGRWECPHCRRSHATTEVLVA